VSDGPRCPSCFSETRIVSGGFLERGPYGDEMSPAAKALFEVYRDNYADEQDVEGRRCVQCGYTFCVAKLDPRFDDREINWITMTKEQLIEGGHIERDKTDVEGGETPQE